MSTSPVGPGAQPLVFVVGCARSGTTLLTRMLDAHPQLAMTPETHWIPKFYPGPADETVTPALLDALAGYHRIDRLGLARADLAALLDADGPTHYADFVARFFARYAHGAGKPHAGDKTPSYVRVVPFLARLWPQARFIHLIRDGRDVALSALGWDKNLKNVGRFSTWADEPLLTCALWWEWNVAAGRAAGRALGPERYREIAYEALLAEAPSACAALAQFLGLPYDDAMLRFHEGRTRADGNRSAKKAWLPPTQGLRDWRSQMQPAEVELFEAAAGDLLSALGYARAHAAPSDSAQARAAHARARFASETASIDPRPAS